MLKRKSDSKIRPLAVLNPYTHNRWIVFTLERNSIPEIWSSNTVVFLSMKFSKGKHNKKETDRGKRSDDK